MGIGRFKSSTPWYVCLYVLIARFCRRESKIICIYHTDLDMGINPPPDPTRQAAHLLTRDYLPNRHAHGLSFLKPYVDATTHPFTTNITLTCGDQTQSCDYDSLLVVGVHRVNHLPPDFILLPHALLSPEQCSLFYKQEVCHIFFFFFVFSLFASLMLDH